MLSATVEAPPVVEALADLLFPRDCLLCGESLLLNTAKAGGVQVPLCPQCLASLHFPKGPRCRSCSQPLISELDVCMRCRGRSYPFARNLSLFSYRGEARELIHQYKFRNERSLGALFACLLSVPLLGVFSGLPVVPAPARPAHVRKRGWDPVNVVAGLLRRRYGIKLLPVLQRMRTAPQKSLDFDHRSTNLRGKILFRERGAPRGRLPPRVILLDDVFTTGATASECTRVLTAAGVTMVEVLTIAVD
ncbi:MAG TPA: ComF family protein [Spirochaetia bacterium]|nr:ComF family protein [Spirochaetia bacterium]